MILATAWLPFRWTKLTPACLRCHRSAAWSCRRRRRRQMRRRGATSPPPRPPESVTGRETRCSVGMFGLHTCVGPASCLPSRSSAIISRASNRAPETRWQWVGGLDSASVLILRQPRGSQRMIRGSGRGIALTGKSLRTGLLEPFRPLPRFRRYTAESVICECAVIQDLSVLRPTGFARYCKCPNGYND